LVFVSFGASGAVRYRDEDFSIVLGGDWVQLPLYFVEHVAFGSKSLGLHVKMMGITKSVSPERMTAIAKKVLEDAMRQEIASAAAGVKVTITHHEVSDIEGGSAATYKGYDSSGRAFLTIVHVRAERSLMMFFEAPEANARNLEAAASDVLKGLYQ